jgi:hypothetical protein
MMWAMPRSPATARRIAVLAIAVACALVYALDWESPVRTVIALAFVLVAPGLAIVELLRLDDPLLQVALVPATSIALGTLVAILFVSAAWFTPERAFICLEVITLTVLGVAAARDAVVRVPPTRIRR